MVKTVFANRSDFIFLAILLVVSVLSWALYEMENSNPSGGFKIQAFTEPPQTLRFANAPPEPVKIDGRIGQAIVEFKSDGSYRIASSSWGSLVKLPA